MEKNRCVLINCTCAEIYPCENDLHLQSDFDLQAVVKNSPAGFIFISLSHSLAKHL